MLQKVPDAVSFLNSVFASFDGDLSFDVDGEQLVGGDSPFLEKHVGKLRISPITSAGSCFVFGVKPSSCGDEWASCLLEPTAQLWREDEDACEPSVGTSIFVWAFDVPQGDTDELNALGEALGMEDVTQMLPVPGTDKWQVSHHSGPTYSLAMLMDVYVNGNDPESTDPGEPSADPEQASGASGFRTYAAGEKYHDAVCVTEYNEADYSKEIIVAIGANRQSKNWKTVTTPVGSVLKTFCIHEVGKKDGRAIVLGDMAEGQRLKTAMKEIYMVGLDIDTGVPTAELDAKVAKLGCVGVRYTTNSHGKMVTEVKKDTLAKFSGSDREIEDDALIQQFLREREQWDERIVQTARYKDTVHTTEGIMCQIEHAAMDKNRVALVLKETFKIRDEGATQAEAMKKWAKVPEALARLLGVPFDTSCTDPSRLFYLPRHQAGKPFSISLFGGDYFDWRTLELDDPMEKLSAALNKGKSKSVTEGGRALGPWFRERGHGFQAADVIESHADDRIRHRTGNGIEIECPFDDNHHNPGNQEDRACFVQNATEGPGEFFTIKCQHQSCRQYTNLDMLGKMIADEWVPANVLEDEQFNAVLEDDHKPPPDKHRLNSKASVLETVAREYPLPTMKGKFVYVVR